ncbi:MAG: IS91 family transposase [Proteobacteria bacterium]|nr:IS91 family transposase [Pseudomonadota bacterium]
MMTQINNDCRASPDKTAPHSPELADILRRHISDYRQHYALHPEHYKVVGDIMQCRTAYLGGHMHHCSACDKELNVYNSCRNRHCPKCQTMTKAKWLEDRKAELLPVTYFHSVFTLPHDINPVALCNKRKVYGILFQAVSKTLLKFGRNPENGLEGKLGVIAILHTWNQRLEDHIHLHGVIPGGVLSFDHTAFRPCAHDFLFPVKALSKVFRGIFMELFVAAFEKGELIFPGRTECFGTKSGFKKLRKTLWSKAWVVYAKKPFDGPKDVLGYIARYTHRVAISNHRIVACEGGKVTFNYRNRKANTIENETIDAVEFIRRFLLHAVPPNFMRIRHYGLFANRNKKANINRCRTLLGIKGDLPQRVKKSVEQLMLELTGNDISRCPFCKKGVMKQMMTIPRFSGPGSHELLNRRAGKDSS